MSNPLYEAGISRPVGLRRAFDSSKGWGVIDIPVLVIPDHQQFYANGKIIVLVISTSGSEEKSSPL